MAISVTVTNTDKVVAEIKGLPPEALRLTVLRMSQVAYEESLKGAQRHSDTGAIVRSLYNRPGPFANSRQVGHDVDAAPHVRWVLWGSRPHVILPKNRKSLRWAKGGAYIFAKKVNHPGYDGDQWIIAAADKATRDFVSIATQAMKDAGL